MTARWRRALWQQFKIYNLLYYAMNYGEYPYDDYEGFDDDGLFKYDDDPRDD